MRTSQNVSAFNALAGAAAVVVGGVAVGLAFSLTVPAMGASSTANGSISGAGQKVFSTVRTHNPNQALYYKLRSYTTGCGGGGNLTLRPLRTNGNWMAGSLSWPIGTSGSPNSTKSWGGPGAISGGDFRLTGSNNGWCGSGSSYIAFQGTINY